MIETKTAEILKQLAEGQKELLEDVRLIRTYLGAGDGGLDLIHRFDRIEAVIRELDKEIGPHG